MSNVQMYEKMIKKVEEITNNYVKSLNNVSNEFKYNSKDVTLGSVLSTLSAVCSFDKAHIEDNKEFESRWKAILDTFIRANRLNFLIKDNEEGNTNE